jgi:serine/threonine protein kinase
MERLGVGGMAEVFRAVISGAEGFYRELAIKRIRPDLYGNPEFEQMFVDEARIAAKLNHPNITQIFDFDHIGNFYYIAMEYVHGKDLSSFAKQVINNQSYVPVEIAIHIVLQVLAGLRYAHEKTEGGRPLGIIHRDISPGNILISYDGDVKLTDFGIAKAIISAAQTKTGELKGKYSYMSPEQIKHQPVDARSDLFSIGAVFYEILTGQHAFRDSSDYLTLDKIVKGEFLSASKINPKIPGKLNAILSKSLATDPAERFQSAAEMIKAIEEVTQQLKLFPTATKLADYIREIFPDDSQQEPEPFFGKYRLRKSLRSTAATEVFLGEKIDSSSFHRLLAIKRVRPEFAVNTELNNDFIEYAKVAATLHHPNIAQIIDADRTGNIPFVAMEYVPGQILEPVIQRLVEEKLEIPLETTLHIADELLKGLSYAHKKRLSNTSAGIVHGHIHPNNVLVSYDGDILLADFAIDLAIIRCDDPASLQNNYPYLSPEQKRLEAATFQSDIFSIGAVLLHILCQQTEFDNIQLATIQECIKRQKHISQATSEKTVQEVAEFLFKAMTRSLADRFENAAGMRKALKDLCSRNNLEPSRTWLQDTLHNLYATEKNNEELEDILSDSSIDSNPSLPGIDSIDSEVTPVDLPTSVEHTPKSKEESLPQLVEETKRSPTSILPPISSASSPNVPSPKVQSHKSRSDIYLIGGIVLAILVVISIYIQYGSNAANTTSTASYNPPREMTVLFRMIPAQKAWYRKEVFTPFEKKHNVKIKTVEFNTIDETLDILRNQKIDLVKTHLALTRILFEEDLVTSVEKLLTTSKRSEELKRIKNEFRPVALDLSRMQTVVSNPIVYLPRKLETLFLAYRRSKVKAAIDNWTTIKKSLEQELTKLTGHGLPKNYTLEENPEEWDRYDLLVTSYYWARTEQDDGGTFGRVAHRTYPGWSTVFSFMSRLAPGDNRDRLELDTSDAILDMFKWLALYREMNLLHPRAWSHEMNITGRVVFELIRRGEVYLTTIHSLGTTELLGSPQANLPGVTDIDDWEFTRMVKGVSVEFDKSGNYKRQGRHKTPISGWFWGIPKNASDPMLSYELMSWMTSKEIHSRDVEIFNIQPIRNDVLHEYSSLGNGINQIVKKQMDANQGLIIPRGKSIQGIKNTMKAVSLTWKKIILERGYMDKKRISRKKISALLKNILDSI